MTNFLSMRGAVRFTVVITVLMYAVAVGFLVLFIASNWEVVLGEAGPREWLRLGFALLLWWGLLGGRPMFHDLHERWSRTWKKEC